MPGERVRTVIHVPVPEADSALRAAVRACIEAQRLAWREAPSPSSGDLDAVEKHVSPEALEAVLTRGADVSDIRTDSELSNCKVFHADGLQGSVHDADVVDLRRQVDVLIPGLLASVVDSADEITASISGHFWYPPRGYMGWHTNSRVPGWRAYLTVVDRPGASFFRYFDEGEGVVTSWDTGWDLRLFAIDPAAPFWHAVASGTYRSSFGYSVAAV